MDLRSSVERVLSLIEDWSQRSEERSFKIACSRLFRRIQINRDHKVLRALPRMMPVKPLWKVSFVLSN